MRYKLIFLLISGLIAAVFASANTGHDASGRNGETASEPVPKVSGGESSAVPVMRSASAVGEEIIWQVISSGGTQGSSASYGLKGTAAQTAVSTGSSATYNLSHGFWQEFGGDAGCCGKYTDLPYGFWPPGYTGNTNCSSDGKRTLSDITKLIDHVYISKEPLCCFASGNTNGSWDDGDCKITLSDITKLIDAVYISKMLTEPCIAGCER